MRIYCLHLYTVMAEDGHSNRQTPAGSTVVPLSGHVITTRWASAALHDNSFRQWLALNNYIAPGYVTLCHHYAILILRKASRIKYADNESRKMHVVDK